MCGFSNLWVFVGLGFVMCDCVCLYYNDLLCECVGFVICGCVYVWVS